MVIGDSPRLDFVGEGGLEPPRPEGHWHLKPARLPFRHSPQQPGEPITRGASLPNRAGSADGPSTAAAWIKIRQLTCFDLILRILLVPLRRARPIPCK